MDSLKQNKNCPCTPEQLFAAATTLSGLLASSLSLRELQTVINLLQLATANLSAIIDQQEICSGDFVETQD